MSAGDFMTTMPRPKDAGGLGVMCWLTARDKRRAHQLKLCVLRAIGDVALRQMAAKAGAAAGFCAAKIEVASSAVHNCTATGVRRGMAIEYFPSLLIC